MKTHLYFCIIVLTGLCAQAQPIFTTNSLPSQIGQSNFSYFSTNIDVTAMLELDTNNLSPPPPSDGATTVAQYWDFSQAQQPYESVLRTDIIAPQDGANNEQFPEATYA